MWTPRKKVYLYAKETDNGIMFKSPDYDEKILGHWAWGNEKEVKFVIKALIDLYWPRDWYDIYEKYNRALLHVAKNWPYPWLTGCLTLYIKE